MGFQGSVESFSLADVFQNLAMNQQTGTLRVFVSTGSERHIYFESGQVRYLSHGTQKPLLLGEILVGRGVVTEEQLAQALAKQAESHEPLGACLVGLGFLSQEQVDDLVRHQIEEEIYDLFGWEKAQFEFNDGPPPEALFTDQSSGKRPSLPISHLIMEAARRVDEWEQLKQQVPSFREIYAVDSGVAQAATGGTLETDAVEKRVLATLDGARDVEDVIHDACLFRFEVLTALAGFLRSSMIRQATPQELAASAERLEAQGLHARRTKVLERQLSLGGDNPVVRRALAEALAGEGQTDKAAIHFSVLADLELQKGQEDGAGALYRRILQIVPQHLPSRERLGSIYAKRGQKKEAVIQYQELIKSYLNNRQYPEARSACLRALECEPANVELRQDLIQVLSAEGDRAGAAREHEILGDQFAKQAQIRPAADNYRKAMQLMPSQVHLKKKLASVMLTQEDRRARTKRTLLAGAGVLLVLVVLALVALRELRSWQALKRVEDQSGGLIAEAQGLEERMKFQDAISKYEEATGLYKRAGLEETWSPVVRVERAAKRALEELAVRVNGARAKFDNMKGRGERDSRADILAAEAAYREENLYAAREGFQKVLDNEFAPAPEKDKARQLKAEDDAKIKDFEAGMALLAKPPREAFRDVKDEYDRKVEFLTRFGRVPQLSAALKGGQAAQFYSPVKFRTQEDGVLVYLEVPGQEHSQLMGTAGRAGENVFRYNSAAAALFRFVKKGYRSVSLPTPNLSWDFEIRLEREASRIADLEVQPAGPALVDRDSIWIGTSTGALLKLDRKTLEKNTFTLLAAAGLKKEVIAVFPCQDSNGKARIVYVTQEGDCVGVDPEVPSKPAWKFNFAGKALGALNAPPAIVSLKQAASRAFLLAPLGKKIKAVQVESGQALWPNEVSEELPKNATTTPLVLESVSQTVCVVGCEDGKLYGIDIASGQLLPKLIWPGRGSPITGTPVLYGNKYFLATAKDGSFYQFPQTGGAPADNGLNFDGEILGAPVIRRSTAFFGTSFKDGFFAYDLEQLKRTSLSREDINGGVTVSPLLVGDRVYLGTNEGTFYCLEVVDGNLKVVWSYRSGSKLLCPPVAIGESRIAFFCVNGKVFVFEE